MLAAFAHQPVAATVGDTSVSQYTLPDGTVLSLCLYTPAGDNAALKTPCEFCRIADVAFFSPPGATGFAIVLPTETRAPAIMARHLLLEVFEPATPLRGPPKAV